MQHPDPGDWLICFNHNGISININGSERSYTSDIPFGHVNDGMWHYLGASWSSTGHLYAYVDNIYVEEFDYQPGAFLPEL